MTSASWFPSISFVTSLWLLGACAPAGTNAPPEPSETPHAIILMIADGAGLAHWSLAVLERDRYTYIPTVEDLRALASDTVDSVLGLFAEAGMGTVSARGDALTLMTSTALRVVGDDPDGFFLLIERPGASASPTTPRIRDARS